MKTVIQEYTEYILNIIKDAQDNDLSLEWLKNKIEDEVVYDYLLKEKQQIIDAFNQGYRDSEIDAGIVNNHQDIELFANAEYYFNDKYKPVSK